ncbi:MAG: cytochrome d ubiquinol oxidase subunit II [Bacteroidetes bacterium]|nr:MAG: cytochrome d ubiquinol oxidase subunit II [Bacteroidota bacterium]
MVLNNIWFLLLIFLFGIYIILDGFKLGAGIIHLGLKSDGERKLSLNALGPVQDFNEPWFIFAVISLFTAFPKIDYSNIIVLFLSILFLLITRTISITLYKKLNSERWNKILDIIFCLSSYIIVLIFGISLGNLISGIPLYNEKEFSGTFLTLLNPYSILTGITAVMFIRMYGKIYLVMNTEGEQQNYVSMDINSSLGMFVIAFLFHAIWTFIAYPVVNKNFIDFPVWFILPAMIVLSIVVIPGFVRSQLYFRAFIASSAILAFCVVITAVDIYPNLIISNPNPENSLTIFNAASSEQTLLTMLFICCILIPAMIVYKVFVYRKFKAKASNIK